MVAFVRRTQSLRSECTASEGLKTAVVEGTVGGQAGTSPRIENYRGFFRTGLAAPI